MNSHALSRLGLLHGCCGTLFFRMEFRSSFPTTDALEFLPAIYLEAVRRAHASMGYGQQCLAGLFLMKVDIRSFQAACNGEHLLKLGRIGPIV